MKNSPEEEQPNMMPMNIELTIDGRSRQVCVWWSWDPVYGEQVHSVLDGTRDVRHLLDYINKTTIRRELEERSARLSVAERSAAMFPGLKKGGII